MIQIALLLFGVEFVRSKFWILGLAGILWGSLGLGVMYDGLDGALYFPMRAFGLMLLLESIVTLSVAASGVGSQRAVLYFKGGIFFFVAVLILANNIYSHLLLAIIFGLTYFVIGLLTISSAWVVRFPHWRSSLVSGVAQLAFAGLLVSPYPIALSATVSFFLGALMIVSGFNTVRIAHRVRRLRDGTSTFELLEPRDLLSDFKKLPPQKPLEPRPEHAPDLQDPLIVHIWTPEGTAGATTIPRPIINRYIAAVDEQGVISTGHAALELSPSVYLSLYPVADIDRSPAEFFRILKATRNNDVPGTFQPDYATEVANWCDSDRKIIFHQYSRKALIEFSNNYRQQATYNLTYRNCSSSVAFALEASMDGVLSERSRRWRSVLQTLLMPELWIAAQVRKRAMTMAWTPGLVMDYARALRVIVHPVPRPWFQRIPWRGSSARSLPDKKQD